MIFGKGEVSTSKECKVFKNCEGVHYDFLLFFDSRAMATLESSYQDTILFKLLDFFRKREYSYLAVSRPKNLTVFATLYNFLKLNSELSFNNLITNLGFVDYTSKKQSNIDDILLQINQFQNFNTKVLEQEEYVLAGGNTEVLKTIEYSQKYLKNIENTLNDRFEKVFFINTPSLLNDFKCERERPKSFYSQLVTTNNLVDKFTLSNKDKNKLVDIQNIIHTYDGVHYTLEGHKEIFEKVIKELEI